MVSNLQHNIKIKCYSGIKCTSKSQQTNLRHLQNKEDRLNKVYDSDGEQAPEIINVVIFPYTYEKFEIFPPLKKSDLLAAIPQINVKSK